MGVVIAAAALLLDVGDFPVGGDLTVATRDAAAPERREAEKSHETHHDPLRLFAQQFLYRRGQSEKM